MPDATYDPTLSHPRDEVRLALGDIGEVVYDENNVASSSPFLVPDATIDALIARYDRDRAIGKLARSLASRFAQEPDWLRDEGGGDWRWNQRVKVWQELAAKFDPLPVSNPATVQDFYPTGKASMPPRQTFPILDANGRDSGYR